MKRTFLLLAGFMAVIVVSGQQLKPGIPVMRDLRGKAFHPTITDKPSQLVRPAGSNMLGCDEVIIPTVIELGSSVNGRTYGYHGGQRTMVWADDNLKTIINVHRMGPGATPPGLSGYLAVDQGSNGAQSPADWLINQQIYASTLNLGLQYYSDAARFPQAAIYNPYGNTDPDNAYIAYYCANYSNNGWGGLSYGVNNLTDHSDSTKHMQWFDPPPWTYIPSGFSVSQQGIALVADKSYDETLLYHGQMIITRGVWNQALTDFEYTQTAMDFPTTDNHYPADVRVAFAPDGQRAWVVILANNGGAVQIGDSANYYPVLLRSDDAGQTWEDPVAIQLDGPDGLPAVLNYLSDYRINELYGQMVPRDEIPFTTAFDCDLAVDKWGNPHIGVIIGVSAGEYTIASGDSAFAVFDIYSTDDGATWNGLVLGHPWTFRGEFGDEYEDQRINVASNMPGDKIFFTWLDTQIPGITDNISPDVFIRGFDLVTNKLTSIEGEDQPQNMTYLTDIYQQAYFQCTSHYVFTEGEGHIIPLCSMMPSDLGNLSLPVTFNYLADFKLMPSDYTIPVANPPFPVGIKGNKGSLSFVSQNRPNPFSGITRINVSLPVASVVEYEVTDITGKSVILKQEGMLPAGTNEITIDGNGLKPGVYLCTFTLGSEKVTRKLTVR